LNNLLSQKVNVNTFFVIGLLALAGTVSAGGGGMPWDGAITAFVDNITGPLSALTVV